MWKINILCECVHNTYAVYHHTLNSHCCGFWYALYRCVDVVYKPENTDAKPIRKPEIYLFILHIFQAEQNMVESL